MNSVIGIVRNSFRPEVHEKVATRVRDQVWYEGTVQAVYQQVRDQVWDQAASHVYAQR